MKILHRWINYCQPEKTRPWLTEVPLTVTWVLDEDPYLFCLDCRTGLCRYRLEPPPEYPRHLEPGIGYHPDWPPVSEWKEFRWGIINDFERDPLVFIMEALL